MADDDTCPMIDDVLYVKEQQCLLTRLLCVLPDSGLWEEQREPELQQPPYTLGQPSIIGAGVTGDHNRIMASNKNTGQLYYLSHFCCLAPKLCLTLLKSHGLQLTRLLCLWDFPGKNTGVVCHFLLQGILLTQGLYPGLLHCRQILYQLSYQGSKGSLNPSFKSSFKHSSRVIFLDYGQDNNIVLKKFQFPCMMFSNYKYEFLTKAYYNLTSLLLSNLFLSILSSLYVLATVAFFRFLIFVCSFPTSMPWQLAFCLKKTLC